MDVPRESRMSIYSGTLEAGANDGDVGVGVTEGMPGGMDAGTNRTTATSSFPSLLSFIALVSIWKSGVLTRFGCGGVTVCFRPK